MFVVSVICVVHGKDHGQRAQVGATDEATDRTIHKAIRRATDRATNWKKVEPQVEATGRSSQAILCIPCSLHATS